LPCRYSLLLSSSHLPATATTALYTLSLHDALPILPEKPNQAKAVIQIAHGMAEHILRYEQFAEYLTTQGYIVYGHDHRGHGDHRSEEHTSELQSRFDLVCRLLLEKKKNKNTKHI